MEKITNIIESAVRQNLLFETGNQPGNYGLINVIDLWNMPIIHQRPSVVSLNVIANIVNNKLNQPSNINFINDTDNQKSKETIDNELRLEIIKYIIKIKQEEQTQLIIKEAKYFEVKQELERKMKILDAQQLAEDKKQPIEKTTEDIKKLQQELTELLN